MNWSGAIKGAQLGMMMGAVIGAVPLVVGCLIREYRKAVVAFLATLLAGTLGGLYGAIAVAAMVLTTTFRPSSQPRERATQWESITTKSDKVWWIAAALWAFVCLIGAMFVMAAFVEPDVLSALGYSRKDPAVKLIEPALLFAGMAVGICMGLWGVSLISRNFLSSATHQKLAEDMQTSVLNSSRPLGWIVRRYYGLLLPARGVELRPRR